MMKRMHKLADNIWVGEGSIDVQNKLLLADLSIDIFVGGDSMHIGTNHRDQEIRFGKDVQQQFENLYSGNGDLFY